MLDPKKQAEFDQAMTAIVDHYPPTWWRLYQNLVKEGFDESQAMDLVKTWIMSLGGNG